MSRVEQFENIRRDHRVEGLGVRALSARYKVHRRKVRQALASPEPPERKTPVRQAPVLGPWQQLIVAWLLADREVPVKQRHTAHRIWTRLRDEYGVDISESTVRFYVAEVRTKINDDLARVTVAQHHGPGEEAEVDFGEFWAFVDGVYTRLWMFGMRLSHSGRAFHIAYAHQAQEAFFEGHVLAFEHLGGVPGRIRYDNLKAAVAKVLFGRDREENERFIVLRSHYGFDSFYCLPGKDGAHEKGGIEGDVGRFRRNHLVPMPVVATLDELNAIVAAADARDDARHITRRHLSVGESAAAEAPHLAALPEVAFDPVAVLRVKVDTKGRVCVRQCFYSVPQHLAGREVTVRLGARALSALAEGKVAASHARSLHKVTEDLVLDHYLEILTRKPGAMPGSTALVQARASGAFGPSHDAFWTEARRRLGDGAGTRALIGVLLLQRRLPASVVEAAMDAALRAGSVDPQVVAIEARRIAEGTTQVVAIGVGSTDTRPTPSLDAYDALLAAGSMA
jgi:transposase